MKNISTLSNPQLIDHIINHPDFIAHDQDRHITRLLSREELLLTLQFLLDGLLPAHIANDCQ